MYPLKLNAYCPLRADSFPLGHAVETVFTVIDRFPVAVVLFESVTCTVNGYVPAVVGVPEITPAALNANPGGSGPVPGLTSSQL